MPAHIVLMLAHDGVSQPGVWSRWLRTDPEVRLFVHAPASVIVPQEATHMCLDFGRTKWGTYSIVRETVRAFAELLRRVPGPFLVALVSGSCIPIAPPARFRALPYQTMFGAVLRNAGDQVSQWFVATREGVERIVAGLSRPEAVDSELRRCYADGFVCADNIVLLQVVGRMYAVVDSTITAEFALNELYDTPRFRSWATEFIRLLRNNGGTRFVSPIAWQSMDEPVHSSCACERFRVGRAWTLREVILASRDHGGSVFLRKVCASVRFDDAFLTALFSEDAQVSPQPLELPRRPPESGRAATMRMCALEMHRQHHRSFDTAALDCFVLMALKYPRIWKMFRDRDYDAWESARRMVLAFWTVSFVAFTLVACTTGSAPVLMMLFQWGRLVLTSRIVLCESRIRPPEP